MRWFGGEGALLSAIAACISAAQRTASTTLENSINSPSPVVLTMRPRCSLTLGSPSSRRIAFSAASVPSSSAPHQPRIARDVGGQDRGKAARCGHSSGNPALRRPVMEIAINSGEKAGDQIALYRAIVNPG